MKHKGSPRYKDRSSQLGANFGSLEGGGAAVHLSQALGTSPVTFGDFVEGRDQTEDVIAIITTITQEQAVLCTATATYQTDVLVHLKEEQFGLTAALAQFMFTLF